MKKGISLILWISIIVLLIFGITEYYNYKDAIDNPDGVTVSLNTENIIF